MSTESALQQKVVAIGPSATNLPFLCIPWSKAHGLNLVDFHVVLLDLSALDDEVALQTFIGLNDIKGKIDRLLQSSGTVIVLTGAPRRHSIRQNPTDQSKKAQITTSDWLRLGIRIHNEQGTWIETSTAGPFDEYLDRMRKWEFFLEPAGHGVSAPYRRNREGKILAGKFSAHTGGLYVLPVIRSLELEERAIAIIGALMPDLMESYSEGPPGWAEEIDVPGIAPINARLAEIDNDLSSLTAQRKEVLNQKTELEEWRKLLFTNGPALDAIVQAALSELGTDAHPARFSDEDFVIHWRERFCVCEVKGTNKSTKLNPHLRQLIDYLAYYEEDTPPPKGIFFGNPWRRLPLEERGTPDAIEFPNTVIQRAESLGITLVGTRFLFEALCKVLDGKLEGSAVLDAIVQSSGMVDWPGARK